MAIVVRRAGSSDVEWLLEQLKHFSQFFGSKKPLFTESEHSRVFVETMVRDHVCFVAVSQDGARMGFIAGYEIPHPFNPEIRLLSEVFWWVAEEFRGSRAGLMLFYEFDSWGEKHADMLVMSLEAKSPVNERFLLRRGYRLQERGYLKEVA